MRKIYVYRNDDGEVPVLRFIESTHKKIRNKFDFMLHFVKDERNLLCEPYVKHFSIDKYKMLYELRIRANGTMVRVIYSIRNGVPSFNGSAEIAAEKNRGLSQGDKSSVFSYKAEENIILLHAFFKKSRRDTENALEYALKILSSFDDSALYPTEHLTEV